MSQANRKTTTTSRTTAKTLIAAHKAAVEAEKAADRQAKTIPYFDQAVYVPELGARYSANTLENLDIQISRHVADNGLSGLDRLEFQKRMEPYRFVLKTLDDCAEAWRKHAGVDLIEQRGSDAYDAVARAWKALVSYTKGRPSDMAEIARYAATLQDIWRLAELLKAIGGGKAVL